MVTFLESHYKRDVPGVLSQNCALHDGIREILILVGGGGGGEYIYCKENT